MILVTGANGFLGSKLIGALLDQGEKIRAFVRVDSNLELIESFLPEIELFKGDILDISDVQSVLLGIDYSYHCAAFISFSKNDRQKMFKTNVEGTANLVNIALDFPIKKIVVIHDLIQILYPEKVIHKILPRRLISSAIHRSDCVATVSEHSKKCILNYLSDLKLYL